MVIDLQWFFSYLKMIHILFLLLFHHFWIYEKILKYRIIIYKENTNFIVILILKYVD